MEVIIQIIIVIVIISSVLKQIKAVSEKSGDLGKPKTPGRDDDMDDTVKPMARTARKPSTAPYQQEPVPRQPKPIAFPVIIEHEEAFAETGQSFHRIGEPDVPTVFDQEEVNQTDSTESEPYMPAGTGEEVPSERIQYAALTASRPALPVSVVPGFSAREVTQGIIMREILGPPVSLREGELL
ncbi:hypothetical protein ACFL60_08525 [Candidatus Omnitrophota bacterium]